MAPKQKATSAPKGGKQGKKGSQIEKKCIATSTEDYGIEKAGIQSEIICDKKKEETVFWYHKNFCIPIDLRVNKTSINEKECPNFASNQLLELKSKMNLRWKAFLFPPWSVLPHF